MPPRRSLARIFPSGPMRKVAGMVKSRATSLTLSGRLPSSAGRCEPGPSGLEITRHELTKRLSRTARGIKPALMDQKLLAGIGNIYADEVLHHARIHPERGAGSLSPRELARLHLAIGEILKVAIALEGSSFDAGYRTVLGLEGGFLAQNSVYGRESQPCRRCSRPITKTRIAGLIGRPTYFCPHCQRRP